MSIRIVVEDADAGMAANVGGPVNVSYRTFDIEFPALEIFLRKHIQYGHRRVIGTELLLEDTPEERR